MQVPLHVRPVNNLMAFVKGIQRKVLQHEKEFSTVLGREETCRFINYVRPKLPRTLSNHASIGAW